MLGVVLGSGLSQGGLGKGRDLGEAMQMMEQAVTGCLQLEENERQRLVPIGVDEGVVAGLLVDVAVSEGARPDLLQRLAGLCEPAGEMRQEILHRPSGQVPRDLSLFGAQRRNEAYNAQAVLGSIPL